MDNPTYEGDDFTPQENIPDDPDDVSFSKPEDLAQHGTSSTSTYEERRISKERAMNELKISTPFITILRRDWGRSQMLDIMMTLRLQKIIGLTLGI